MSIFADILVEDLLACWCVAYANIFCTSQNIGKIWHAPIGARHFELLPVSHGRRHLSEVKTDANLPFTHVVSDRKSSFFVTAEPEAITS